MLYLRLSLVDFKARLRFRVLTCPKSPREGVECLADPGPIPSVTWGSHALKERSYLVLAEEMAAGNRNVSYLGCIGSTFCFRLYGTRGGRFAEPVV